MTEQERDEIIRRMAAEGRTWTDIGATIGKTRDAVRRRASVLGIARPNPQPQQGAVNDERPLDPTDREIMRLEQKNAELEAKNRAASAKLRDLRRNDTVYQRLAAVIRQETPPLPFCGHVSVDWERALNPDEQTACDMVLVLADEHADLQVTREESWGLEEYDFDVFRVRLERLRDLVQEYATTHLPRHHFERLWIFKLGDAVNGDIHEAGPWNHFRNTMKAALAVGDAEAQFVQSLVPYFPKGVHVVGVSGNHPRRSKMKEYKGAGAHDNYDFLVGTQMATRLQAEIEAGRVTVNLPEAWTAFVDVRGKLFALNHGDDVSSGLMPWVGFDRRNNRVQTLLQNVERKADFWTAGHYHTAAEFPSAGGRSLHSGTWMRVDPYAQNKLALGGAEPTQTLYVVNDKPGVRGLLMPIPIYLASPEKEEAMRAGEYEPDLGRRLVIDDVAPRREKEGLHVVEVE